MDWIRKNWVILVFCFGLVSSGITGWFSLKAKAEQAVEKVAKVEAEVEEAKDDIKETEETNNDQNLTLKELSVMQNNNARIQEMLLKAVEKLSDKVSANK